MENANEPTNFTVITVSVTVDAPIEKCWEYFNQPEKVVQWAFASDEWHAPSAENDLRVGGNFKTRMEAKDGSFGFDFGGVYQAVQPFSHIAYIMEDGRTVTIDFETEGNKTLVTQNFDAENTHPLEMQQAGWQAILNNYKKLVESGN